MLIIVYSLFIPEWMMMISSTFDTISKQQCFKTMLKSQVIWKSAIKFSNRCTVTCILLRGCYNFQSQSGKVTLTPLEKTSTDWAEKTALVVGTNSAAETPEQPRLSQTFSQTFRSQVVSATRNLWLRRSTRPDNLAVCELENHHAING